MHVSDAAFAQEKCVSDINPQMKQYSWGHAQLVHWKAYDGTPLDGLLYVPEGIEPGAKLPMMIYFYEKRSETLYNHIDPRPSRPTVNLAFYCSRGYVVFVPDIVSGRECIQLYRVRCQGYVQPVQLHRQHTNGYSGTKLGRLSDCLSRYTH